MPAHLLEIKVRPDWQSLSERMAIQRLRYWRASEAAVAAATMLALIFGLIWNITPWIYLAQTLLYVGVFWLFPLVFIYRSRLAAGRIEVQVADAAILLAVAAGVAFVSSPYVVTMYQAPALALLAAAIPLITWPWLVRTGRRFPIAARQLGLIQDQWPVFLLIGAAAGLAMLATRAMMRRLAALAAEAEAVRRGDKLTLTRPAGADDVSRIGTTLAELVDQLQQEKRALQALNRELDGRVAERSARIERLADDSRQAAVTRERLRMARDLHDTLSHSLMALLTQIRLVRKLGKRLDADALEDELALAEAAAAGGVAQARSAIAQMRASGVGDAGLGAALRELVQRFGERSGVAVSIDADAQAAHLADARAEAALRIAQEALHNVEHHAQARAATVSLRWQTAEVGRDAHSGASPPRVTLAIADDGVGFDPSLPVAGHYGMQGMREQAELIAGQLQVHSQPGQGTRIELAFDA